MKKDTIHNGAEEQALVKLYAELTGATESCARSVFMHVSPEAGETSDETGISLLDQA